MTDIERYRRSKKIEKLILRKKNVVKFKMADPFYDKDLEGNILGCVMKSPIFMVSNDLNIPRVRGVGFKSPIPIPLIPHRSKKTLLKKSISLIIRLKSIR